MLVWMGLGVLMFKKKNTADKEKINTTKEQPQSHQQNVQVPLCFQTSSHQKKPSEKCSIIPKQDYHVTEIQQLLCQKCETVVLHKIPDSYIHTPVSLSGFKGQEKLSKCDHVATNLWHCYKNVCKQWHTIHLRYVTQITDLCERLCAFPDKRPSKLWGWADMQV